MSSKLEACFSHKTDEWGTPTALFNELNNEFNFTLDPCCTMNNHKCDTFFTKEQDGLTKNWGGHTVFCNPPYSNIKAWVEKADYESAINNVTTVMLVPARTDTKWFHDKVYKRYEIRFIKGRLKFNDGKGSAPFPSMIIVFR